MWEIELSTEQLDTCRTFALQRSRPKRQYNVTNRRVGKQSDFDIDYLGLRGEFAFAEVFNLPVHQITSNLLRGDGGHQDFELFGFRISVKTRFANRRYFLVPVYLYPPQADILVGLEEVSESTIRLKGWCTRQDFVHLHQDLNLGCGPTKGIMDRDLRAMDDLLYVLHHAMTRLDSSELVASDQC